MILFDKVLESLRKRKGSNYYPDIRNSIIKPPLQQPDNNTPVTAHTLNSLLNILGADGRVNGISGLRAKNGETK